MREKEIYSTPREHIIEPCACDHDHFFQLLKCLYYIYMCVCVREFIHLFEITLRRQCSHY